MTKKNSVSIIAGITLGIALVAQLAYPTFAEAKRPDRDRRSQAMQVKPWRSAHPNVIVAKKRASYQKARATREKIRAGKIDRRTDRSNVRIKRNKRRAERNMRRTADAQTPQLRQATHEAKREKRRAKKQARRQHRRTKLKTDRAREKHKRKMYRHIGRKHRRKPRIIVRTRPYYHNPYYSRYSPYYYRGYSPYYSGYNHYSPYWSSGVSTVTPSIFFGWTQPWWYGRRGYRNNWPWFAFTAMTAALLVKMSQSQQKSYAQAQLRATEVPIGEIVPWKDSHARGSIMPTREGWSESGRYCREFQQTIRINGRYEKGYGTACRQEDGQWKIVNTDQS